ncbi:MAG: tetratricopeptide repeat protein [Bacteroidota bacterium]|nr:tetratricopeptide repeat protein [Bacteroidota bacterium]MDP3145771.1 tetratricopeptide repeat protein [Bacteroidota bacterium]MDP3556820.1 tetratricopeptide repeat protein [Bacteroidota bacterium]
MESELKSEEEIIKKIDEVNEMIWNHRGTPHANFNPTKLLEEAFENAIKLDYKFGIAQCNLNAGMGDFIIYHKIDSALKYLNKALFLFKQINNNKWIANAQLTLAIINNSTGNPEAALYDAMKGIEFYEKNEENIQDVLMAYYVVGTVYKDLKKNEIAEKYFLKGAEFNDISSSWLGRIYTGLSNINNDRGEYKKALELAFKSLDILKNENNKIGESRALNDIGFIYKNLKKYEEAIDYFLQGLKIREEANVKHFVLGSLLEIASTFLEIGNSNEAINYYLKAELIALETNHLVRLSFLYQKLAELYKTENKHAQSINYYEKLINQINIINSKEKETKIDTLQNTLLQEKEQEIERLRNVDLKNAYTLISEKNKEITDSIKYALRIQNALLASDNILNINLLEYFVLFNPKDIVSGDFYWATEFDNNFFLASCDSTGHGVPGAFMSLLNITYLNEAITEKKITKPNEILNHVRSRLIENLSHDGAQDGMDGILICINKTNNTITYSAANNAPIIIRNNTIIELPKDKMPIGKGEKSESFTLHTINYEIGDCLYLYTDGFADQFGGAKGKKFNYKKLNELLVSVSQEKMAEQKVILDSFFKEWKGNLEQVDDVCMIGIRI